MKTNTCILAAHLIARIEQQLATNFSDVWAIRYQDDHGDAVDILQFADAHSTWDSDGLDWQATKATLFLFLLEAHDSELAEMEQEAADAELERQLFH